MSVDFSKLLIQDYFGRQGQPRTSSQYTRDPITIPEDPGDYAENASNLELESDNVLQSLTNRNNVGLNEAMLDLLKAVERQNYLHSLLRPGLTTDVRDPLETRKINLNSKTSEIDKYERAFTNSGSLSTKHQQKIHSSSNDTYGTKLDASKPVTFRRSERLAKKREQVEVQVRVVFLKIGEIDTLKELFHADIFVQTKWMEKRLEGKTAEELQKIDLQLLWNPLVQIDNILSESKEHHWMLTERGEDQTSVYVVERRRLHGIFMETLELNDFPLDVQDLTVTLTSERPDSQVVLLPDKTDLCGINLQTLVDQQEWRLHEHIEVTRRSTTKDFTTSSQRYPFISITCRAARRPGYFYWNVFLIMFFITGLSFATFAVPPERPESRLQLSFTLFLTSVAFKFVINQSLPKISYLTYMDKYVLMSLAILCVISVWHAVIAVLPIDVELHSSSTIVNETKGFFLQDQGADGTLKNKSIVTETVQNMITQTSAQNETMQAESTIRNRTEIDTRSRKQSLKIELERRRIRYFIEREVFTSFCVLYVLAHLTFLFWLYFDASKRRREMLERDKIHKRLVEATKSCEKNKKA